MNCATNQFPELKFLGPQNKPHVVHGLGKHYNMRFGIKLVNFTYEIRLIPCACNFCPYSLEQPWIPGLPA